MTGNGDTERLSERYSMTAVIRVVRGADGAVLHGELLDATSGATRHFAGWEGLVSTVREWLGRADLGRAGPSGVDHD